MSCWGGTEIQTLRRPHGGRGMRRGGNCNQYIASLYIGGGCSCEEGVLYRRMGVQNDRNQWELELFTLLLQGWLFMFVVMAATSQAGGWYGDASPRQCLAGYALLVLLSEAHGWYSSASPQQSLAGYALLVLLSEAPDKIRMSRCMASMQPHAAQLHCRQSRTDQQTQ